MEQGASIGRPSVTREHGAWAVLLVPLAVGAVVGGTLTGDLLLLLLAVLAAFMACVPGEIVLRHFLGTPQPANRMRQSAVWATAFLLVACVAGLPVVFEYPAVAYLGCIGVMLFALSIRARIAAGKGLASDLLAVVGLTLTAPASYQACGGTSWLVAFKLWALNTMFFGSSVFYVRMKMDAAGAKRNDLSWSGKLMLARANLLYHCVVVGLVMLLAITEYSPGLAILAFVPMLVHVVVGTLRLGSRVRFRRLGVVLLAHSILFGVILSLAQW